MPQTKGRAAIAINEYLSYYNVRMNSLDIIAGQDVTIKIKPVHHVASERFKSLDVEKRNCLFHDEGNRNSMFNSYNFKACQFECRLSYAVGKAGCLPWDYVLPSGIESENVTMCVSESVSPVPGQMRESNLARFERAMNSNESLGNCSACMPNCEEVTYETQLVIFDLDVEDLCNEYGNWNTIDLAMRDWERTSSPTTHWFNELSIGNYKGRYKTYNLDHTTTVITYTNISFGLPTKEALAMCKHKYKYEVARLSVQILEPEVTQIKKDVRISFSDQLGVIGE